MSKSKTFIKEIEKNYNLRVTVRAWVEDVKKSNDGEILSLRDASGRTDIRLDINNVNVGDYIEIIGAFSKQGNVIDVTDSKVEVIVPFPETKKHLIDAENLNDDTVLGHRYLLLRQKRLQRNLEVVDEAYSCVFNLLRKKYFKYVETPAFTKSVYEYTKNDFIVKSPLWHPEEEAHLVQSPQLYKQMLMSGGVERYFQLAKNFRAEHGDHSHLQEFTQLCVEMLTNDRDELMELMEEITYTLFKEIIGVELPRPFVVTTEDLTPGTKIEGYDVRWITNHKMARLKNGRITPNHHVMTLPMPEYIDKLHRPEDLLTAVSTGFDLEIDGLEVAGGDMRITNAPLQRKILHLQGYNDEDINYHYGALLKMLEHGVPQHGGFAFGLSRICMLLMNENHINNMIAFPTDDDSRCTLLNFPFMSGSRK